MGRYWLVKKFWQLEEDGKREVAYFPYVVRDLWKNGARVDAPTVSGRL